MNLYGHHSHGILENSALTDNSLELYSCHMHQSVWYTDIQPCNYWRGERITTCTCRRLFTRLFLVSSKWAECLEACDLWLHRKTLPCTFFSQVCLLLSRNNKTKTQFLLVGLFWKKALICLSKRYIRSRLSVWKPTKYLKIIMLFAAFTFTNECRCTHLFKIRLLQLYCRNK